MNSISRLCAALAAASACAASSAATVYEDEASFLASLQGPSYTEPFTGIAADPFSITFTSGASSFTVASGNTVGGIYSSGTFVGAAESEDPLIITFGPGITAVGGQFFLTDTSDDFVSAPVTLTLDDGTVLNYTPSGFGTFRGFTSTVPITSLTFAAGGVNFASIDNLTVGSVTAVPEAGTLGMMLAGLCAMTLLSRQRQRQS